MTDTLPVKKEKSPSYARYVRLTPKEHTQLLEDESRTGRSAQELIKTAYFEGGRTILLMSEDDKNTFLAQLNRIGNNVNQIAKKLNTGIIYGFDQDMTQVRTLLTHLMKWITAKYNTFRSEKEVL